MQDKIDQPDPILDTTIQAVGECTGLDLTAIELGLGPDRLIHINNAPAAARQVDTPPRTSRSGASGTGRYSSSGRV